MLTNVNQLLNERIFGHFLLAHPSSDYSEFISSLDLTGDD
jgi:hypothetical protein